MLRRNTGGEDRVERSAVWSMDDSQVGDDPLSSHDWGGGQCWRGGFFFEILIIVDFSDFSLFYKCLLKLQR